MFNLFRRNKTKNSSSNTDNSNKNKNNNNKSNNNNNNHSNTKSQHAKDNASTASPNIEIYRPLSEDEPGDFAPAAAAAAAAKTFAAADTRSNIEASANLLSHNDNEVVAAILANERSMLGVAAGAANRPPPERPIKYARNRSKKAKTPAKFYFDDDVNLANNTNKALEGTTTTLRANEPTAPLAATDTQATDQQRREERRIQLRNLASILERNKIDAATSAAAAASSAASTTATWHEPSEQQSSGSNSSRNELAERQRRVCTGGNLLENFSYNETINKSNNNNNNNNKNKITKQQQHQAIKENVEPSAVAATPPTSSTTTSSINESIKYRDTKKSLKNSDKRQSWLGQTLSNVRNRHKDESTTSNNSDTAKSKTSSKVENEETLNRARKSSARKSFFLSKSTKIIGGSDKSATEATTAAAATATTSTATSIATTTTEALSQPKYPTFNNFVATTTHPDHLTNIDESPAQVVVVHEPSETKRLGAERKLLKPLEKSRDFLSDILMARGRNHKRSHKQQSSSKQPQQQQQSKQQQQQKQRQIQQQQQQQNQQNQQQQQQETNQQQQQPLQPVKTQQTINTELPSTSTNNNNNTDASTTAISALTHTPLTVNSSSNQNAQQTAPLTNNANYAAKATSPATVSPTTPSRSTHLEQPPLCGAHIASSITSANSSQMTLAKNSNKNSFAKSTSKENKQEEDDYDDDDDDDDDDDAEQGNSGDDDEEEQHISDDNDEEDNQQFSNSAESKQTDKKLARATTNEIAEFDSASASDEQTLSNECAGASSHGKFAAIPKVPLKNQILAAASIIETPKIERNALVRERERFSSEEEEVVQENLSDDHKSPSITTTSTTTTTTATTVKSQLNELAECDRDSWLLRGKIKHEVVGSGENENGGEHKLGSKNDGNQIKSVVENKSGVVKEKVNQNDGGIENKNGGVNKRLGEIDAGFEIDSVGYKESDRGIKIIGENDGGGANSLSVSVNKSSGSSTITSENRGSGEIEHVGASKDSQIASKNDGSGEIKEIGLNKVIDSNKGEGENSSGGEIQRADEKIYKSGKTTGVSKNISSCDKKITVGGETTRTDEHVEIGAKDRSVKNSDISETELSSDGEDVSEIESDSDIEEISESEDSSEENAKCQNKTNVSGNSNKVYDDNNAVSNNHNKIINNNNNNVTNNAISANNANDTKNENLSQELSSVEITRKAVQASCSDNKVKSGNENIGKEVSSSDEDDSESEDVSESEGESEDEEVLESEEVSVDDIKCFDNNIVKDNNTKVGDNKNVINNNKATSCVNKNFSDITKVSYNNGNEKSSLPEAISTMGQSNAKPATPESTRASSPRREFRESVLKNDEKKRIDTDTQSESAHTSTSQNTSDSQTPEKKEVLLPTITVADYSAVVASSGDRSPVEKDVFYDFESGPRASGSPTPSSPRITPQRIITAPNAEAEEGLSISAVDEDEDLDDNVFHDSNSNNKWQFITAGSMRHGPLDDVREEDEDIEEDELDGIENVDDSDGDDDDDVAVAEDLKANDADSENEASDEATDDENGDEDDPLEEDEDEEGEDEDDDDEDGDEEPIKGKQRIDSLNLTKERRSRPHLQSTNSNDSNLSCQDSGIGSETCSERHRSPATMRRTDSCDLLNSESSKTAPTVKTSPHLKASSLPPPHPSSPVNATHSANHQHQHTHATQKQQQHQKQQQQQLHQQQQQQQQRLPFVRDGNSTDCDESLLHDFDFVTEAADDQTDERLVCIESISLPDVVVESTGNNTSNSSNNNNNNSSLSSITSAGSEHIININGATGNSIGNVHFVPIHVEGSGGGGGGGGGGDSRGGSPANKRRSLDDSVIGGKKSFAHFNGHHASSRTTVEITTEDDDDDDDAVEARTGGLQQAKNDFLRAAHQESLREKLKRDLVEQESRYSAQLEDAQKNAYNLQTKLNEMQVRLDNMEKDLAQKTWNVDRLQSELIAAHKDDEYVRKRLKLLEDEKTSLRHKYCDNEEELNRKYEDLEQKYKELEEKYKETRKLASNLQTQYAAAQTDAELCREQMEQLRLEMEEQVRILQNSLENSVAERKISEDKWQKEFEMLRNQNQDREESLMTDCEWQLRQMQRACKEKIDKAEHGRREAIERTETLECAVQERLRELQHLRPYEAEVKSLRGLINEQEQSLSSLNEQIETLRNDLQTANENLEEQIEAVRMIKYQCDNKIYDKERELIQRIDDVRNEAAAFWENKLYTEMTRLKSELESVFVDERRDALDKLQAEHIEELRALTTRYTANEEELRAELADLQERLEQKSADFLELREKSDNALLQTRMHLDRADREYQNAMCREEARREALEESLHKEFEEEKLDMEEKFRERLDQVKEEFNNELQLTTQEMREKHKKELAKQKAKLQAEKEAALQELAERHRKKLANAEEKIKDIELRHQRDLKDLKADYDADKAALDKRDISNANEIEQLHRKCRCLTNLFEEMRMRYERRDPRQEDLREIAELRSRCESQERDLYLLTDRLREMQIQMEELATQRNATNNDAGAKKVAKAVRKPPPKTIPTNCDVIYEENEERESPPPPPATTTSRLLVNDDEDDEDDEEEESEEEENNVVIKNNTKNQSKNLKSKLSDRINEDDGHMISAI